MSGTVPDPSRLPPDQRGTVLARNKPDRAKQFRQRAAELRTRVEQARTEEQRRKLLEIVEAYHRLASALEGEDTGGTS